MKSRREIWRQGGNARKANWRWVLTKVFVLILRLFRSFWQLVNGFCQLPTHMAYEIKLLLALQIGQMTRYLLRDFFFAQNHWNLTANGDENWNRIDECVTQYQSKSLKQSFSSWNCSSI